MTDQPSTQEPEPIYRATGSGQSFQYEGSRPVLDAAVEGVGAPGRNEGLQRDDEARAPSTTQEAEPLETIEDHVDEMSGLDPPPRRVTDALRSLRTQHAEMQAEIDAQDAAFAAQGQRNVMLQERIEELEAELHRWKHRVPRPPGYKEQV